MSLEMIVGCQLGDEGKGAEIDRHAQAADLVVRCAGGNNAGHTVVYQGQALALHLLPSSITKGKQIAIGAGVTVDPIALVNEIRHTNSFGINPIGRMTIDPRSIFCGIWHRVMDVAQEIVKSRSGRKIGTTARGIGPSYADQVGRSGLRFGDLLLSYEQLLGLIELQLSEKEAVVRAMGLNLDEWKSIFQSLTEKELQSNKHIRELGIVKPGDLDYTRFADPGKIIGFNRREINQTYLALAELFRSWQIVGDVSDLIHTAIMAGKKVLVEGAQGAHLDNIYGTFPFVTSSCTLSGGACLGLGIGPTLIDSVRGVAKAYTTRVGNGPFPTVMDDELATAIRGDGSTIGDEYGASTGRPRDCGWFDATLVRSACRWNGVTKLTLTKLDMLSKLESILVGVEWIDKTTKASHLFVPAQSRFAPSDEFAASYLELPGWQSEISSIRDWNQLPTEAQSYVNELERLINLRATSPIVIDRIGVGPGEDQVIVRET